MQEGRFVLKSPFKPQGDQPQAIEALAQGVQSGMPCQVLLGVTGSGKTYTMASVIERVQRPTLVIAHNKTLAAQLCAEFREFFPDSAVEYFVSYYDYYQPEAYIASTDTYIEKDSAVNEEIERLRHSATAALRERRDVIVVASVSCIYSMGDPSEYEGMMISLRPGMAMARDELIRQLVDIQYDRSDIEFERGTFRVRGDVVEIFPAGYDKSALRVEFFGDEIDRISAIDVVSGHTLMVLEHISIYPATHYATPREAIDRAIGNIEHDLDVRIREFKEKGDLIEAQRIAQRTQYDIEMLRELGYCTGIENYSRYFDGRQPGDAPYTLLDYFPKDYIVFVDESHVTLPQIRAMYNGDRARKEALVSYGFRLPSAFDNRPLRFEEFEQRIGQLVCVSATPAPYELEHAGQVVEQIIRPTGLLDPEIEVRPAVGQVDDLYAEIIKTTGEGYRVLVTTLTKKMAESLTTYLSEMNVKVRYLHSDVQTMERQEIIRYYLEFLEDASEDERSALGTPEELAQRILRENGIFPPDTAAAPPKKNSNRIAKWIILACTCSIWIPLLTTWYSLLLTALIVLAVIPIALCAALLGGLFTFVLALFQDVPSALMQLGMGLACGGVAALVAYPIWIACKSIVKFALFTTKKMWHFVTKGDDTP